MAEAVTVVALVQSIITLSDKIRQAAKGVYYLQEKCAKLGSLVEEIHSSLGNDFRRFNEQSRDRLLKLKSALEDAEVFVRDMSRWRKAILAYVLGGASSRLDDIEREILRSIALLNLHVTMDHHRLLALQDGLLDNHRLLALHDGVRNPRRVNDGVHNPRREKTLCWHLGMGFLIIVLLFIALNIILNHHHDPTSTFKGWVLHRLLLLQRFHNFILV